MTLEMGTCLGITSAYLADGTEINGSGCVVTIEGAKSLADMAAENLKKLDIKSATIVCAKFQDCIPQIFMDNQPVSLVFVDGHHSGRATEKYLLQMLPYLSDDAIVMFDDIAWSAEMMSAWKTICEHEAFFCTIELLKIGVAIKCNGKKRIARTLVLE